jgi:MFS superfamily sulfate permease-like transporter
MVDGIAPAPSLAGDAMTAGRRTAPWPVELLGGSIGAVVMLAVVLTLGLLGFAPLGGAAAAVGIAAAFVTATLGGLVFALFARSALPTGGPSSATALIFAGLVAQLATDPQLAARDAQAIGMVLCATGVTVMLAGAVQVALAAAGLGRLAQWVPQPVLAGFMNGVAVLILLAQLPALLGLPSASVGSAGAPPAGLQPATLAVGLATAVCAWAVAWRWPRAPSQLIGLLAGLLLYATLHGLQPGVALGPLVGPLPTALPLPDVPLRLLDAGPAAFVWRHAGELLTAALVLALIGSLETVLSAVAVDQLLDTRHDPRAELLALGASNLLVGLFGGLPVVLLRARALATLNAGGRGRRAALIGAVAFGVMYALLGPAIALLPLTVLAGVMLTVAWALADRWTRQLVTQWRSGERSADVWESLAIVAIVCAVTVWKGFAVGVGVGVVLALAVFVRGMNRSLIRSRHNAVAQPSRRIYPAPQEALLHTGRACIEVLELEGALFFGSADRLAREADRLGAETRFLVLDLRGVGTIDASGAMLLQQLSLRLQRRGVALLLAGVAADHAHGRRLRAFGCFRDEPRSDWFADADRAIEAAERQLLADAGLPLADSVQPVRACALFQGLLPAHWAVVREHVQSRVLPAGAVLFHQGDPADGLYVLTRGSITVLAGSGPAHAQRRFASFSAGLMFGETAMLDGGGRSATAIADTEVDVHLLTQRGLDAIAAAEPAAAAQIYRNIAAHLSVRLRLATSLRPVTPG